MSANLFHIPIHTITLDHIQGLLATEQTESKLIEYKRELPPSVKEWKEQRQLDKSKDKDPIIEFACDVSAMANSDGGDIVFGIDEKSFQLSPLIIENWDQTRNRLEQLILSNIEPRLLGFDFSRFRYPETLM